MIDPHARDPARFRRLRPRDWARLDRELRQSPIAGAHRVELANRRPALVVVTCDACGAELGEVRAGASVLCRSCRVWSGGPAERGKV